MTISKLLLDEKPLLVLPQLAVKIGLNEAITLQQLHFHIVNAKKKSHIDHFHEDRWWVYNSYEEWRENDFPFWSVSTIKRIFLKLETLGLALSNQLSKNKSDRKKWYSIDYEKLANIDNVIEAPHRIRLSWSSDQIELMHGIRLSRWMGSDWPDGYTESPREVPEIKDSPAAKAPDVIPVDDKPKPVKSRDPLYDAVAWAFKTRGSYAGKIKNFLTGKTDADKGDWFQYQIDPDNPMTPQEIVALRIWCERTDKLNKEGTPAKTPSTLNDRVEEFRCSEPHGLLVQAGKRYLDKVVSPLPVEQAGQGDPDGGNIDISPEKIAEYKKATEEMLEQNRAVNQ